MRHIFFALLDIPVGIDRWPARNLEPQLLLYLPFQPVFRRLSDIEPTAGELPYTVSNAFGYKNPTIMLDDGLLTDLSDKMLWLHEYSLTVSGTAYRILTNSIKTVYLDKDLGLNLEEYRMGQKPKLTAKEAKYVERFDEAVERSVTKTRFQAKDKKSLKSHVIQGGKRKDSG